MCAWKQRVVWVVRLHCSRVCIFKCVCQLSTNVCLCVCVPVSLHVRVCVCAWSPQTKCNNWRPSCRFHTINVATLEVMKVNQRLKGELLLKKAFRAPSPSLNYPHNALLILYPPSLHRTLFISFTAFHIRATQCYVHSTQCVHILISDQLSLIAFPFFLPSPWIHPPLQPCPSYFLKPTALCLHICPDLRHCHPPLLFSFASLPFTSPPSLHLFLILFNETEDPAASGGDPHSPVPVCTDCLSAEWLGRGLNRIDESVLALLL